MGSLRPPGNLQNTHTHTYIHTQTLTVTLDLWIAPEQLSALPAGTSSKTGVTGALAAYLDTQTHRGLSVHPSYRAYGL